MVERYSISWAQQGQDQLVLGRNLNRQWVAQMKSDTSRQIPAQVSMHDLAQSLNVIRLAAGNIRIRILPELAEAEAAYLANKLDRIEQHVDRSAAMAERLCHHSGDESQQGN